MVEERFDYVEMLETMPQDPGCYLMRAKGGKIVYIGKAKNLRERVRTYFTKGGDHRSFVPLLPEILTKIDVIITANEKEALILEANLIKKHRPIYNVRLKDDKQYLSLRVDTRHEWPRVEVIRKRPRPMAGVKLFGPFDSSRAVWQTLELLNASFFLRTCADTELRNRTRPCLQYQIKRCPGPCTEDVDAKEYHRQVKEAVMFLEGRSAELEEAIREKMMEASRELDYEKAAKLRDQLKAIEKVHQSQTVVSTSRMDRDAFNLYREGADVQVGVLHVRGGKLQGAESFSLSDQLFPDNELLSSFLSAYYQGERFLPDEVLLPLELPESDGVVLGQWLSERRGKKVALLVPQRGSKVTLVETAAVNAKHSFKVERNLQEDHERTLLRLRSLLKLPEIPRRIECYDISNFQGKQIVGSMVVFIDGVSAPEEYRHYRMKEVTSQDDFASMREMLNRRFRRVVTGEDEPPDLVVIDGGKGQLGQALAVLSDLGIDSTTGSRRTTVVSLAKSRVDRTGFEDAEVTRSRERVFMPNRKNPIVLKQNSSELYLFERVRDEAHRFAITYHKTLRRKETLQSSIEEIPGVGKKIRIELLRHFKSLKKVKEASYEELINVPGIGPSLANQIVEYYRALRIGG